MDFSKYRELAIGAPKYKGESFGEHIVRLQRYENNARRISSTIQKYGTVYIYNVKYNHPDGTTRELKTTSKDRQKEYIKKWLDYDGYQWQKEVWRPRAGYDDIVRSEVQTGVWDVYTYPIAIIKTKQNI